MNKDAGLLKRIWYFFLCLLLSGFYFFSALFLIPWEAIKKLIKTDNDVDS